jgi:hypothetical protein
MLDVFKNLDILGILRLGLAGLCFLLSWMCFVGCIFVRSIGSHVLSRRWLFPTGRGSSSRQLSGRERHSVSRSLLEHRVNVSAASS